MQRDGAASTILTMVQQMKFLFGAVSYQLPLFVTCISATHAVNVLGTVAVGFARFLVAG